MRQVGIIAAGALHALENNRKRLVEDHANAKRLATGLGDIAGIHVDRDTIDTNMVYFSLERGSAPVLVEELKVRGVLVLQTGDSTVRAVTSLEVSSDDIDRAINAVGQTMAELSPLPWRSEEGHTR